MDNYSLLDVAFAGLMHDIGKFYQRSKMKSDLSEEELRVTPLSKDKKYHTHLHSGYTSRFLQKYMKIQSEYEMLTSGHHLYDTERFSQIIRKADQIASAIDRNDELHDYVQQNQSGVFQQVRLGSILSEINFGKSSTYCNFKLNQLSKLQYPNEKAPLKNKTESVEEYKQLFDCFIEEVKQDEFFSGFIDRYAYDRLYALLYEYTTTIPASTYEGNTSFVSLFDHSKLCSAIASCLYLNESNEKKFCLFEFDISGIQKFIFKIVEGTDTKRDIAKSLRGRSLFVSLLTEMITYHMLHEFHLTQSNILFHTGGGALLLLPCVHDYEEKIKRITEKLAKDLFEKFGTDLSFVYSYVLCDENELEQFKTNKAIELKGKLEQEKSRKFSHILNSELYVQKAEKQSICKMCGSNYADENTLCNTCETILKLSNFFVKHPNLVFVFDFHNKITPTLEYASFRLGEGVLYLIDNSEYKKLIGQYDYIECINQSKLGSNRHIANLVPQKMNQLFTFEEIVEQLIGEEYGDKKLGVLKMDVDNLGAVFAFGLSKTRSLSKFLMLSRLMDLYFSQFLMTICKQVSKIINPNIDKLSDNGSMFYINYAGGDDLVILGPAAAILELANEIHTNFKRFTKNDNMTISGGIFIQNPKEPIRFGVQRAEEQLAMSKMADGKNSITLLDTTCTYEQYDSVLKQVHYFKQVIDQKIISRSVFYQLMMSLDNKTMDAYLRMVPRILYSLKRNVTSDMQRSALVRIFSKIKDMDELRIVILEMKLAIMQTRR